MVSQPSNPSPHTIVCLLEFNHASKAQICLNKFCQIDAMNIFAQGRSWAVCPSDPPDNCGTSLVLMMEFYLFINLTFLLEIEVYLNSVYARFF